MRLEKFTIGLSLSDLHLLLLFLGCGLDLSLSALALLLFGCHLNGVLKLRFFLKNILDINKQSTFIVLFSHF